MKILMVAPRFSPKSGGGGYVITKNLIKALEKQGFDIGVFTSDYEYDMYEAYSGLNQNGKHVWIMPFKTIFTLMGFHITRRNPLISWRKGVFTEDVDVVHMQGCRTFQNIVAYKQCKKYHIPYIVDAHGFPIQGGWMHKLVLRTFDWLFANKIVKDATFCVAETEIGKQEYLRAGVKEDRIKIIPCPYDLSVFNNLPMKGEFKRKYKLPSDAKIIGFLGGLDKIKGLDFLVESFADIEDKDNLYLVLAGTDMGFGKELHKLVNELGIDDEVIFTDYISGRDKLEYLVDCDICVFPSRTEQGLPFAALEAIMCNTPIIVTEGTGAAEDCRKMGQCFIIDFGNVIGLSSQIKSIIGIDDFGMTILNEMVFNQQQCIRKNLSIDEKANDYSQLYIDIKSAGQVR